MKTWTSEQLIRSLPLQCVCVGPLATSLWLPAVMTGEAHQKVEAVSFLGAEMVEPEVTYRTPAASLGAPQVRTSVPA